MSIKICAYVCVICFAFCSAAVAGPIDNASQFQQKAAASAMKKPSSNAWKYTTSEPAKQTGKSIVSPPADLQLGDVALTSTASEDTPVSLRLEEPNDAIAPAAQKNESK